MNHLNVDFGESPRYLGIAEFDFDPGLKIGDEIRLFKAVFDKNYSFKAKVIHQEKELHCGKPEKPQDEFHLVILVEAEDRDLALEMFDCIKKYSQAYQQE